MLDLEDAPGIFPGADVILAGARLIEFDHQRRLRLDVLEKMEKVMACAEVDQIGALFEEMACALLQRRDEHAVQREFCPEAAA